MHSKIGKPGDLVSDLTSSLIVVPSRTIILPTIHSLRTQLLYASLCFKSLQYEYVEMLFKKTGDLATVVKLIFTSKKVLLLTYYS